MDIRLRAATALDIPKIKELQPREWGDIIPNIRFYLSSSYCYLIVAEQQELIMGCGAVIEHGNCIWLANIIVGEEYRGLGLGTMITSHLFNYSKKRTKSILLIATALGFPIYKKLGFIEDVSYTFFEKQPIKEQFQQHILPYHAGFKEDLLRLDYEATGELREKLLAPKLHDAYVYAKDNYLQGFMLPHLGEGLVIAKTTTSGLTLMEANVSKSDIFALPKSNVIAIEHAMFLGYKLITNRTAIKMYWGNPLKWNPALQYGRIGGNLG